MAYRVHKVTPSDILGNYVGVTNGAQNNTLIEESYSSPGSYVGIKATTEGALLTSNIDSYGVQQYLAPNGEVVNVPLYKLVGDVFTGPSLDPNFWNSSLGTGGSVGISGGELTISTGTTANNAVELTSVRVARFSGLAPNKFRAVVQLPDTGVANNTRHWGLWTATSGATYQMSGTTFQLVTRKDGIDSVVTNGNFNGQYGPSFTLDTNAHVYEIIWQPRQVVWTIDRKILHTFSASATPWTDELHLPIHFGNVNSGGSTTNVSFQCRLAVVARFGIPQMQPTYAFVQGLTAGQNLKNSPGEIHGITISGVVNNSVITLYDTATIPIPGGAKVIWSTGPMTNNTFPFNIPADTVPFHIGLSVAITGAAANAWIKYD